MRGRLEVISGCMFSGKTTELLRRLAGAEGEGRTVVAVTPARDRRYGESRLATHTGRWRPAVTIARPEELLEAVDTASVVGIDEGHFFGESLVAPCRDLVSRGTRVIVAGVPLDHRGRPFPPFPSLEREADEVVRLTCPCAVCGRPAIHSQRMTPGDEAIVVGGAELYEPRCAACFAPL